MQSHDYLIKNKIFLRDNFKYGVAAGNVKNTAG